MKSIAVKLWLGMTGLVAVTFILLWLFQVVFLKSYYLGQQVSGLKAVAYRIASSWTSMSAEDRQAELEDVFFNYKAAVDVYDEERSLVYSGIFAEGRRGQLPAVRRGIMRRDLLDRVFSGDEIVENVELKLLESAEFIIIGIPIKSGAAIVGALFMRLPLVPVEDTVDTLKSQLLLIVPVLLIAAIIISFVMARLFARPIMEIDRAASRMASGDLSVRLDIKSRDEIGRLSKTMNRLAEQLTRVEQLRRDFIASVSHELRTPLSLIQGYAETIRDLSGENREKREKHLAVIIDETGRLSSVVNDMLDLSQIRAGYLKIEKRPFALDLLLADTLRKYELLKEKLGVELRLDISGDLNVMGDEAKIEQVVRNLVNNSLNFTAQGDSITIRADEGKKSIRVEVSDTGSGINREELEHIWEKYYRAEGSLQNKKVGTGLGLAIVKGILEGHGSNYGVDSVKGRGTTFWFELDRA